MKSVKFQVDLDAQRRAAAEVTRAHTSVVVTAIDATGRETQVIAVAAGGVRANATPAGLVMLAVRRWNHGSLPTETRCRAALLQLDAPVHVCVDQRGQVELVCGTRVVLKMFDRSAEPGDWPRSLRHAHLPHIDRWASLLAKDAAEAVRSIDASGNRHVTTLGPIARCTHLRTLDAGGCDRLVDLRAISRLPLLENLDLGFCNSVRDFASIARLGRLRTLELGCCARPIDLAFLADLRQLRSLGLIPDARVRAQLVDLRPLEGLTRLQTLSLAGNLLVTNLRPVASLVDLRTFDAACCLGVRDVEPLTALPHLRDLDLSLCSRISSVARLARLPELARLDVRGCPDIRDLDTLRDAPALRELGFDHEAARDGVLLACARRRRDPDLIARVKAMTTSLHASTMPHSHAGRVIAALDQLIAAAPPADLAAALSGVATALRARGATAQTPEDSISPTVWQRFFEVAVRAPDPALRAAFETALARLL